MASGPTTVVRLARWLFLCGLSIPFGAIGGSCGTPALGEDTGPGFDSNEEDHVSSAFDPSPGEDSADEPANSSENKPSGQGLPPGISDSAPDAPAIPVEPSEVLLEPLVFVQFTDVHQSRGSGGDKGQYDNWYRSLVYVRDVIEPDFVIVTGDLTEGSGRFGAQVVEQWEDYRQAIDDAGFSRDNFHDVPGNHDARGPDRDFSFYQEYGVSGVPMHRWVQDQGPHRHLFLTLLTTEPGEDEGSLSGSTAIWAAQQLEAVEASHIFVFAHHNHWLLPFAAPDALVGSSGLLARHDVTAFVAGHRHVDWEHTRGGTRYVLTGNHYRGMPRSDAGWMRLFVVSGRQWATKTCYVVDHGPQVMIMSPQDERLVLPRSPGDNQSEGFITVEALAFGDDEPTLQVRLNGGPPQAMEVEGQLHRFSFDATGLPRGDHRLRVEAIPLVDEVTGADEVTFSVR